MRGFWSAREDSWVAAASSRKWMSVFGRIERVNFFEDVGEDDLDVGHYGGIDGD